MIASEQSSHSHTSWFRTLGIWLVFAALAVVIYLVFERFLRVAATILLLAGMLTYLLQPVVDGIIRCCRIERFHLARTATVIFVYLAIVGVVYGMGTATVRTLQNDMQHLQRTYAAAPQHVPTQIAAMHAWYLKTVPEAMQREITDSLQREFKQIPNKYVPMLVGWFTNVAQAAGKWLGLLIELIFVPLVAFYFLTDPTRVREQVLFFVPKRYRSAALRYGHGMDTILRHYVRGQLVLCAIAWAAVTIAMLLMGVPGALLLGVIAGVARAIPVIGPLVGGIPVLGAVLLDQQWGHAFWWVLIGFTALHFYESKFLMPRILGDHLGIHPVIVIISLLVGYEMLGLLGMFLAPPAIAMVRFVLAVRREERTPEQLPLPIDPQPAEPAVS